MSILSFYREMGIDTTLLNTHLNQDKQIIENDQISNKSEEEMIIILKIKKKTSKN